jgi:hypothetical protein
MTTNAGTHTKQFKRAFIRSYMRSTQKLLIDAVNAGRVPKEWNGIELRWLIADCVKSGMMSTVPGRDAGLRKRFRSYANERLVRNLP